MCYPPPSCTVRIVHEFNGKCAIFLKVTMADRASADRACKDPNPIIDGRKANVNLAYLGAKPRVIQPGKGLDHKHVSGR